MRKTLQFLLLAATLAACSDGGRPAAPELRHGGNFGQSRATPIDNLILQLFPKGLETATGKRWDHIDSELGAWDEASKSWSGKVAEARHHLMELSKFVTLKTGDIDVSTLGGETQEHAADRLIFAMNAYAYGGPNALTTLPTGTTDLVVQVVPAGQAALIQTPSQFAGLRLFEGSTLEDRVIAIYRNPLQDEFTARCSGPLPTDRCQYKHFYKFESYPLLKLQQSGRFAVCHVRDSNGPTATEDEYIQLAHNLPADPANYTEGAIQEGQIEILPRATTQTGVVDCDGLDQEEVASGIIGAGQRALYAVAKLASNIIAPKALHAYDQGPEHNGDFFSDFVGVGAPNYVGTWNGTTRSVGSTTTPQPVTVIITSQTDQGVVGEYRVDQAGEPPFIAYNSRPSDGLGRFIAASSVGFNGLSFTIDPFYSPFSAGIKLDHSVTRSFNADGVAVLSGETIRTSLINQQLVTDRWELILTKADVALVGPPPPINIVTLRAAPTGSTAKSTSDAPIQ